jgi:AcrR family transcriptional regulator
MPKTRKKRVAPGPPPAGRKPAGKPRSVAVRAGTKQRAPAKPRWQLDRAGKEQQLLKAFDRLLQEQGAHRLRVNAIVKEAGVGKNLLYAYFGGIEGLAKAWAEAADFLPAMRRSGAPTCPPMRR